MTPDEIMQAGRSEIVGELCRLQLQNASLLDELSVLRRSHGRLWALFAGGLTGWVLYLLGVRL